MTRGERAVAWIEKHLYYQGKLIVLLPHQRADILGMLNEATTHRVRTAIWSYGRKNGKTLLAAIVVLLFLVGPEARDGTEIYSAARSKDQAALTFKYAAQIVRGSPDIADHVGIRDTKKQLYCHHFETIYEALSAEAKTKYGLNPRVVVHDELGQVTGPLDALYTALETAMMAQPDPISIVISTQAATDGDLLSILIDDAANDPSIMLSLHTAPLLPENGDPEQGIKPDPAYPFSEAALRAANPAYGLTQSPEELHRLADQARRTPSQEAGYRNLVLNQRVETKALFVSTAVWNPLGNSKLTIPKGAKLVLGIDLSEVSDLTAVVATWEQEIESRVKLCCVPAFWLPDENLLARSYADKVPYAQWKKEGYLHTSPGASIDYADVIPYIIALMDGHKDVIAGFDRYNWRHFERALKQWCKDNNRNPGKYLSKFIPVGQGTSTMSPALRVLESRLLKGDFQHDANPVMTMCAGNAVASSADAACRKLIKRAPKRRIDGMVALCIAEAAVLEETPKTPQIRI